MEYTGYQNEDYLLSLDYTKTANGKITGFCIGSENGKLHNFDFSQEMPISSLQVESENVTLDFVINMQDKVYTTGRTQSHLHQISFIENIGSENG